jgi:hypothetical protein
MQQFGSDPVKSGNRADIVDWSGRRVTEGQHIMQASGDIFLDCGSAVSVTCFDDACLVAKLVGEPVADEHFDVRRHSLGVRSPLRRQRHLLRLRESLWVSRNPSDIPLRPQSRVSGYNGCQRYYRAGNPERIGGTRPGPNGQVL